MSYNIEGYRYAGMYEIDSLEVSEDGLYQIDFDKYSIDIFCEKFSLIERSDKVLFFFSGAVPEREKKVAPFFSGRSISKQFNLPVVCISDPAFNICENLTLAWYSGGDKLPKLQENICSLIRRISELYNVEPVLIGGSGGGFAALLQSGKLSQLDIANTCIIWNPQTDIVKYSYRFVKAYYDELFLSDQDALYGYFSPPKNSADISGRLSKRGIINSLLLFDYRKSKILYLQNKKDHHYEVHARPFIDNLELKSTSSKGRVFSKGNISLVLGDWGEGHSPPPGATIAKSIKNMCGLGSGLIEKEEVDLFDGYENIIKAHLGSDGFIKFTVCAYGKPPASLDGASYAFYSYVDGVLKKKRFYKKGNNQSIEAPKGDFSSKLVMGVFCRSSSGVETARTKIEVGKALGTIYKGHIYVLVNRAFRRSSVSVLVDGFNEVLLEKVTSSEADDAFPVKDGSVYKSIAPIVPNEKVELFVKYQGAQKMVVPWSYLKYDLSKLVTVSDSDFRQRFTFNSGRHASQEVALIIAKNNLSNDACNDFIKINSGVIFIYKSIETLSRQRRGDLSSLYFQLLAVCRDLPEADGARKDPVHLIYSLKTAFFHFLITEMEWEKAVLVASEMLMLYKSSKFKNYHSVNLFKVFSLAWLLTRVLGEFDNDFFESAENVVCKALRSIELNEKGWLYSEADGLVSSLKEMRLMRSGGEPFSEVSLKGLVEQLSRVRGNGIKETSNEIFKAFERV